MTQNKELSTAHKDAALKGVALGALTWVAMKIGVSVEVVAVALPFAMAGISWVSTKIGDKNTALLLNFAKKALEKK